MAVSAVFIRKHAHHHQVDVAQFVRDLGAEYCLEGQIELNNTTLVAISGVEPSWEDLERKLESYRDSQLSIGREWYRPFAVYADADSAGLVLERTSIDLLSNSLLQHRI